MISFQKCANFEIDYSFIPEKAPKVTGNDIGGAINTLSSKTFSENGSFGYQRVALFIVDSALDVALTRDQILKIKSRVHRIVVIGIGLNSQELGKYKDLVSEPVDRNLITLDHHKDLLNNKLAKRIAYKVFYHYADPKLRPPSMTLMERSNCCMVFNFGFRLKTENHQSNNCLRFVKFKSKPTTANQINVLINQCV